MALNQDGGTGDDPSGGGPGTGSGGVHPGGGAGGITPAPTPTPTPDDPGTSSPPPSGGPITTYHPPSGGRRRPSDPPSTTPAPVTTPFPDPGGVGLPYVTHATPHRSDTFIPTTQPLPIIYGRVANVGAQLVYEKVQLNPTLGTGAKLVKWNVCHGPISTYNATTVDNAIPSSAFAATLNYYTGTKTQTVDGLMNAAETSWVSGQPGIAYVVGNFPSPAVTGKSPDVRNFLQDVSGMLIRDPRTDPTLVNRYFSENPALIIADLLSSKRYGGGVADANIDWAGTFTTAANDCDQMLPAGAGTITSITITSGGSGYVSPPVVNISAPTPGGVQATATCTVFGGAVNSITITNAGSGYVSPIVTFSQGNATATATATGVLTPRFTIGIHLAGAQDPEKLLQNLCDHAQLNLVCNNGLYQIWMDKARAADSVTFTDQGPGANIVSFGPLHVAGAKQCPTRVRVNFVNRAASWKDDFAIDEDPGLSSGAVELVELTMDLRGVRDYDQAKRLARYYRKAKSLDKTGTMRCMAEASQLLPGTRFTVASAVPWNWANQDVVCLDIQPVPGSLQWDVTVGLYSASVFDDTQATTNSNAAPAVLSPYDGASDPCFVVMSTPTPDTIYWSPPQRRSATKYGSAFWSQTGITSFDATKVNDGTYHPKFGDFGTGATLTFDAGVGLTKTFREMRMSSVLDGGAISISIIINNVSIAFSDDNITYTPVAGLATFLCGVPSAAWQASASILDYKANATGSASFQWTTATAHRYWKITANPGISPVAEVQFFEWLGVDPNTVGYNVYRNNRIDQNGSIGGDYSVAKYITINNTPSSAVPLSIQDMEIQFASKTYGCLTITSINSVGLESPGISLNVIQSMAFDNTISRLGNSASYSASQDFTATTATVATQAFSDSSTKAASTAFVQAALSATVSPLTTSVIKPPSDSTTAIKVTKADGTTAIVTVDSTNKQVTLANQFRSRAYQGAATTSAANGVLTALLFDTNVFDVGAVHSVSVNTSRFTVPTGGAGVYVLNGNVNFAPSAAGTYRQLVIRKNGATSIADLLLPVSASTAYRLNVTTIDTAADGDYYEFFFAQDSGGALTSTVGTSETYGAIARLY